MPEVVTMPETPFHDDQDDEEFDRLLRDAGARMRAATTAQPPEVRPTGARETPPRWIVPVAIVVATAAAVVAAVWIAGPATESVRDTPADTGVGSTPDPTAVSLPAVVPIDSTPSQTAPDGGAPTSTDPIAPSPGQPVVEITDADFDGAGGMCLRIVAEMGSADACLTHRQLEDTPAWTVALAGGQAFEITLDPFDPTNSSIESLRDACGNPPSVLTPTRWLDTSCSTDRFWFLAAPESPTGASTIYVKPSFGEPVELEPIPSTLPDGFAAYRANASSGGVDATCLVIASFPDPGREACRDWSAPTPLFVPIAGTVFVVEPAPGLSAVEVHDIAQLSVPITGCTAPVSELAAAIPSTSVMIGGLVCAGASAMVVAPPVLLGSGPVDGSGYLLERATDSSWSTPGGGTSFPCDFEPHPACEVFGVDDDLVSAPLPIPPWELMSGRELDLDPVEVTTDVRSITGGARSADEIADALIAEYDDRTPGDGRDPVVDSFDALGLLVVELTLLDDSTSQARYAVWYRPTESGELRVERAFRIYVCGRGIAAPDMCV
jgi:hypothetical protein